jgi:hypothetical protein
VRTIAALVLVKFIAQSRVGLACFRGLIAQAVVGLVRASEPVAQVVDLGLMAEHEGAQLGARGVESFAQLRALCW